MKAGPAKAQGLGTMTPEMREVEAYYDWICAELKPFAGRRILEIGPGYGSLAERLGRAAERYIGLDSSQDVVRHLKRRFEGRPRWSFLADRELGAEHEAFLRAQGIDTVVAVNLLEHLADEKPALRRWAAISPKGRLLLMVPALPALYGSLDEQAGHYRRYTRKGLMSLLSDCGASVERLRFFNAVGAIGWLISARLLRQDLAGPGAGRLVRLYDRFILPAARLLDPALRRLWGQSLLAVARLP